MIEAASNAATLLAISLAGVDSGLVFDRLDPGTPLPGFLSLAVVTAGLALVWYLNFGGRHCPPEARAQPGQDPEKHRNR